MVSSVVNDYFIWPLDGTLTGTQVYYSVDLRVMIMKGVLHNPWNSRSGTSPLDVISRTLTGVGFTPLQRYSQAVLSLDIAKKKKKEEEEEANNKDWI